MRIILVVEYQMILFPSSFLIKKKRNKKSREFRIVEANYSHTWNKKKKKSKLRRITEIEVVEEEPLQIREI